eukprot:Seg1522.2 transcript_id=Seg1522.2/GoldUCD/mRNA.D3Y31 product="Major antigen" protein_id=Seg1522.2/GoldUCD/D3Y31
MEEFFHASCCEHQLQSLQNYVNELSDQNEILVQTVEELEKEANERVALLESRLQKTNSSLREQTKQCKDYEHELLHTRKRSEDVLRAHEDYKNEASSLAEENVHLQNHIGNLEYDADLLIELINKARTTGKWELAQLDLRAVPYESLVSLHSPGPQSKQMPDGEKRLGEHIAELKRQVKGRDDIIIRLERDLKAKEELYKEVEEKVGMREQAYYSVEGDVKSMETQQQAATSAITHKDILIMKLKSDVQLSREHQRDVAKQLQDCENTIAELQGEIADFQGIVSMRVAETKNKEQSIQILEQLYKSSREKLSQSDRIIEQLKGEVKQAVKQSQDVTAYEDMIRRLETELVAADEQRKQTVKDFNNLKASMSSSDMAVKEQLVILTSKVEEKERENADLRNEVRLNRRKNEAHTAEIEKCRMRIVEVENGFAAKSQQLMDSSEEITRLQFEMKRLKSNSDEQKTVLAKEVAQREDIIRKLKSEINAARESEEDTLSKLAYQGELISKLRDDSKAASQEGSSYRLLTADLEHQLQAANTTIKELHSKLATQQANTEQTKKASEQEIASREETMTRTQSEIRRLEDDLKQAENKITYRNEALQRLQNQQKDYIEEVAKREKSIQDLELQLLKSQEEHRRVSEEVAKSEKTNEQLTKDLNMMKTKYNEAVEENGRLEARVKAYQISSQSEHDVLAEEVAKREEAIYKLKMEKLELEEDRNKYLEKANESTDLAGKLQEQYKNCVKEVQERDQTINEMETRLSDMKLTQDEYTDKIEHFEDEVRDLIIKLNTAEHLEQTRTHEISMKQEAIDQLQAEIENLQKQQRDIHDKLSKREEQISLLSGEASLIKEKEKEKQREISQHLESIKKLEKNLSKSAKDIESIRRKSSDDLAVRDQRIKQLEDELHAAQQRYADVYEELTKAEEDLGRLKSEQSSLQNKHQSNHTQLIQTEETIQHLELELSLTQEKHKTCIQEVAHKDGIILNLQSELDATQQEFENTMEELGMKEEELNKLRNLMKDVQAEIKEMKSDQEEHLDKIDEQQNQIKRLQGESTRLSEEVQSKTMLIKKLENERSIEEQNHESEVDALRGEMSEVRNDLDQLNEQNDESQRQLKESHDKVSKLSEDLHNSDKNRKQITLENEHNVETLRRRDREIEDLTRKLNNTENDLHESQLNCQQLENKLNLTEEQLREMKNKVDHCQGAMKALEDSLEEAKEKITSRDVELVRHHLEYENLTKQFDEKTRQSDDQFKRIQEMEKEIQNVRSKYQECDTQLNRCEEVLQDLTEKLAEKQKESLAQSSAITKLQAENKDMHGLLRQTQNELKSSENANKRLENELGNARDICTKQKDQIQELENHLRNSQNTVRSLEDERIRLSEKVSHLNDNLKSARQSLDEEKRHRKSENESSNERIKNLQRELNTSQDSNQELVQQINQLDKDVNELRRNLSDKEEECHLKSDEIYNCEQTINELHAQLQNLLEDKKNLMKENASLSNEVGQFRNELSDLRQRYKDTAQQLAHHEEKGQLLERNLAATQEQLSTRVADNVKLEKSVRKLQTDNKAASDELYLKAQEIGGYVKQIEQLKTDYAASQKRFKEAMEENTQSQMTIQHYEMELNDSHHQIENLRLQFSDNFKLQRNWKDTKALLITYASMEISLLVHHQQTVERKLLRDSLSSVEVLADANGIRKEEMLQKMVEEACKSEGWDMSEFFQSLQISSIPVSELTALVYVGNLSQRQYQMCRNLLIKYGVNSFRPRTEIDCYKKSLYPSIKLDSLSASVDVKDLFDSTLHALLSSEPIGDKLDLLKGDNLLQFDVKAGLDGSGSHKKRQQLSGNRDDDSSMSSSDHFLGIFMTPMKIFFEAEDGCHTVWENPTPNSIFYTRPISLVKAKESRQLIAAIFPKLQSDIDSLMEPHDVAGITNKVTIKTRVTMLDGKMVSIVQGDSGSFCHYCDITQSEASQLQYLAEAGVDGMPITKTVEECMERWEMVESGQIAYSDPRRKGQCHKPMVSQSGRLFAILHQKLRSLDFVLKIFYHLICEQRVWSEANQAIKLKVAEAKTTAISHVKLTCGGLLIDSPTTSGGNTNAGPTAIRFFSQWNRDAICSLINSAEDRHNFSILLGQLNVCLAVSESVDQSQTVNIERFRNHCYDTMIHLAIHFPWVKVSPSVHQMLAHNWQLFQMLEGKPIAVWSESGLEAWNKHIRNFRSGAGCRARQTSVRENLEDQRK